MPPTLKHKLITAGVAFAGLVSLAAARKLGADPEWIALGVAALVATTASLRSMVLDEKGGGS